MTTLIRDLIAIPERVQKGDFVLKLTEGVKRADETLRSYVVTDQLVRAFDDALAFIQSSVDAKSSKAAYLHGSFGSGKSHFMAVLDLILQGNVQAKGIVELAPILAKRGDWLSGKKFLLVPYHMIGARSMESALLGGYARHVRELHPDAPVAPVFLGEHLFRDASEQRMKIGDDKFFEILNAGKSAGGGKWGALAAGWDGPGFDEAMAAPAGDERRTRLVSDLVGTMFKSYATVVESGEEGFLSLDEGLSVISRHAADLGYDAVVLFLDELILWLASRVADMDFVTREGQKLAKLVEATHAERPAPLISFVARQRDLRDLVGDHVPGAEKLSFADALKHWEGRFHTITLEDRNLPVIAERRILKPRDDTARAKLDAAFAETQKTREKVREILLTREADREMFRRVYPFSPALVQTLVAVSSVLQRERTALKVMLQLLVNGRDTLRLGDLVPVGDLFDVIADGDVPPMEDIGRQFENAKKLYYKKLLPLLEHEHGIRREELGKLDPQDARVVAFHADDRLMKTALLAVLVPEVESLKDLDTQKLAALNHGTIQAPIAGREPAIVLKKFRNWAGQVGEIKIGDEASNPRITIQLSGVDTQAILDKVDSLDNTGNRQRMLRQVLFEELGVTDKDELILDHEFSWRGTRRAVEVLFGNIRELPDDSLRNRDATHWKMVIDFPFDAAGHSPRDDFSKLEGFMSAKESTRTLSWVPRFLSRDMQQGLGTLVRIHELFRSEDRFRDATSHLSATDRQAARNLLDNQRTQLRARLRAALELAYGLQGGAGRGLVDETHEVAECFVSLESGFRPQPPVGANLREAFTHLLEQMLESQFPAHPKFEAEAKLSVLRKIRAELERAAEATNGRIIVEKENRKALAQIAEPLGLGTMHEDAFVLADFWRQQLLKKAAEIEKAGMTVTVGRLREALDEPKPRGLPEEVANLVLLSYADQERRSFFLHSAAFGAMLDDLPNDVELREQKLPDEDVWTRAVTRAGAIFGIAAPVSRTAHSVSRLAEELRTRAGEYREPCDRLARKLAERAAELSIAEPTNTDRMRTAHAVVKLLQSILAVQGERVIEALAAATIATTEAGMGKSLTSAEHVARALTERNFGLFTAVAGISDREPRARAILDRAREALTADELAVGLAAVLTTAETDAGNLLADVARKNPTLPEDPDPAPHREGWRKIDGREETSSEVRETKEIFQRLAKQLEAGKQRRLVLNWRIEERQAGDGQGGGGAS